MEKRLLTIITAIALVAVTTLLSFADERKRGLASNTPLPNLESLLVEHLESLNRLYQNSYRTIDSFDPNNESNDTLLWSKERCNEEVQKEVTYLLGKRAELRKYPNLNKLAQESEVRRWHFEVDRNLNGYLTILWVINDLARPYPDLTMRLKRELDLILKEGNYSEGYLLLQKMSKDSKGNESKMLQTKTLYEEVAPLFGETKEGILLQGELLALEYELLDLKKNQTHTSSWYKAWLKESDELDTRLEKLKKRYQAKGLDFEVYSKKLRLESLYMPYLTTQITDVEKGIATLQLKGVIKDTWELLLNDVPFDTIYYPQKKYIDLDLPVYLHKAGKYTLTLKHSKERTAKTNSPLFYSKMEVELLKDHNGYYLSAYSLVDGHPISDVVMKVDRFQDQEWKNAGNISTGEDGIAHLQPQPKRNETIRISVIHPYLYDDKTYYATDYSTPEHTGSETWQDELLFYPDRNIYRRGQVVQLGLVARSVKGGNEVKLRSDYKGTLYLKADQNGEEVTLSEQQFSTNSNGVAEVNIQIPEEKVYHNYYIQSSEGDRHWVQVEDYRASYLQINLDSIPTGATFGQPMRIYGTTTNLTGRGTPAKVTLNVTDNDSSTHFYKVESDEEGKFEIKTDPITVNWFARLHLSATDALGNTASIFSDLKVYDVSLPLEANSVADNSIKNHFTISTKGQLYNTIPLGSLDRYEIRASLFDKKGNKRDLGTLPHNGEKSYDLSDLPSGYYHLHLYSVDYFGKPTKSTSKRIYLYSETDSKFYGDSIAFAHQLSERELMLGSSKSLTVHIYIRDKVGNVVLSNKILKAGELYHNIVPKGQVLEKVIFTWQGRQYTNYFDGEGITQSYHKIEHGTIKVLGLNKDYSFRPSETFRKKIQVLDPSGNPVPEGTPVLVSVYDKALDELGGDLKWKSVLQPLFLQPNLMLRSAKLRTSPVTLTAMTNRSEHKNAVQDEVIADAYGSGYDMLSKESEWQALGNESTTHIRSDFSETAFYSALLTTDKDGQMELSFELPDTHTTFTLKAYSFKSDLSSEAHGKEELKVESPLMVDLSLPRYMRLGDKLEGELLIQKYTDEDLSPVHYQLETDTHLIKSGDLMALTERLTSIPFEVEAKGANNRLPIKVTVQSSTEGDKLLKYIPLLSNTDSVQIGIPFITYNQSEVSLKLTDEANTNDNQAQFDLYFSPIHLLLSEMAHGYTQSEELDKKSVLAISNKLATYAALFDFLKKHPEYGRELKRLSLVLNDTINSTDARNSRLAPQNELASFYAFISDEEQVMERLKHYQSTLLKYADPDGGFYYLPSYPTASPYLTYILLDILKDSQSYLSEELTKHLNKSLVYLRRSLSDKSSYFKDYVGVALLHDKYEDVPLNSQLTGDALREYMEQITYLKENHRRENTSQLLRYASYLRTFQKKSYPEIVDFLKARIGHTSSDYERMMLELFLAQDKGEVNSNVLQFLMELKQTTKWDTPLFNNAITILLQNLTIPILTKDPTVTIGGKDYHLTPDEMATGHFDRTITLTHNDQTLTAKWEGIDTPVALGGLTYTKKYPITDIPPLGEALTIKKELYVQRIVSGKSTLVKLSKDQTARAGETVFVRYLIENQRDLSMVTLRDTRAAGLEPGNDFNGYGTSDRIIWNYIRNENEDLIYIDYIPKGKHVLELKATANVGGTYAYGAATVQSYYAPEFTGNSTGGYLTTENYSGTK